MPNSRKSEMFNALSFFRNDLIDYCNENRCRVLSFIPCLAAEIAGQCGFITMFELIINYGGKKVYLPDKATQFNEKYALSVTSEQYNKIKKIARSTGQLDIPSSWGVFLSIRRSAIHDAIKNKWDIDDITKKFGITERQISNIVKRI